MDGTINRREFLDRAAVGAAAMSLAGRMAIGQDATSDRVVVGVMGLSRGMALTQGFSEQPNVEVRYVCDTDCTRAEQAAAAMEKAGKPKPQIIPDFRKMLEDAELDALICAEPLACARHDPRVQRGEARVRRKALQPQSVGSGDDGGSGA